MFISFSDRFFLFNKSMFVLFELLKIVAFKLCFSFLFSFLLYILLKEFLILEKVSFLPSFGEDIAYFFSEIICLIL